ncbi:MAG TPA: HAD-IIA family hydrolase [Candidatus Acetothermia bacterium]|nr:HAD-IIA family hydrolase [Candidatus Acetothermia bacterium]
MGLLAYYSNMENEELQSYRAFLVDIDGVLVRGGEVIPGAIKGLVQLRKIGSVFLLSNNSTRSREQASLSLQQVGFPIEADEIVNSAFIASEYLREHFGLVRVWPLGEEGLSEELVNCGHKLVSPSEADWVVAGMDRDLTYDRLAQGLRASLAGARLLATNEDATFPTPDGPKPGAGAVIGALRGMGFSPHAVVGKPSKIAFDIALERAGCALQDVLMIGDRLETDIVGARNAGIDSALVLTGIATEQTIGDRLCSMRFVARSICDLAFGKFISS